MSIDATYRQRIAEVNRWLAVVLAFVMAVWVQATTVVAIAFLVTWVASGEFATRRQRIRRNPVALAALGLLLVLEVGVIYSSAPLAEALSGFSKYRELLYLALLITIFDAPAWRRRAHYAFVAAIMLVLSISYGMLLGIFPLSEKNAPYTVFYNHIPHSFLVAIATYLFARECLEQPRLRWVWGVLAVLAAYNLLYMVPGRTGQVVFYALIPLFAFQRYRWRGLAAGLALAALLVPVVYHTSEVARSRMDEAALDITLSPDEARSPQSPSSRRSRSKPRVTGGTQRLEWYRDAFEIISLNPVFGGGTGSYPYEYARLDHLPERGVTNNPHNEYLMITEQVGVVGLLVFLAFGFVMLRATFRLEPWYRERAQALLYAMAIGCLFNSFLRDFIEGHVFAVLGAVYFSALKERHR